MLPYAAMAATTLSTICAPTQAIPAGSKPDTSDSTASATVKPRWVPHTSRSASSMWA